MLKYWLWLSHLKNLSPRERTLLIRQLDTAPEIYFADESTLLQVEGLSSAGREALLDKNLSAAERTLDNCYEKGIQIITWQDAAYPNRLRSIAQPPLVLYCLGRMLPFDTEPAIAVVGTRSASAYGLRSAKRIGYQIGRCGGTVISGMARGIDAMAMEGALSAGAPVAGVLGCGVDVVYPRENGALFRDVSRWGCLLSEYPPGTQPTAGHFPVRNRILSGLALGVLVVEAPAKSGALITANFALEQGRDVFAVPGSIDSRASEGTNQLIREGAALVTSGWDVMQDYQLLFPGKIGYRSGGSALDLSPEQQRQALTEQAEEKKETKTQDIPIDKVETKPYIELDTILAGLEGDNRLLAEKLAQKPLNSDELIECTQLPAARVLAGLTLLEIQGIIQSGSNQRFSLTGQSAR